MIVNTVPIDREQSELLFCTFARSIWPHWAGGRLLPERNCAKLEVYLIHARPYRPVGKGKIERFFRTVRAQFRTHLEQADTPSLATLNAKLGAWLERKYHQSHTAAWTGTRRWTSGPRRRRTCAAPTWTGSSASATSTS